MAPDTSTGLPQEGFWQQSNITLDPVRHQNKSACYHVTHVASGKVYIGWLGDAWRGLTLMASRLRGGSFPNTTLQHLVNQDHACRLEVVVADSRLNTEDIYDTLRAVMDGWIEAAGANLIHNSAPLPPRKRVGTPARRVALRPATKPSAPSKSYKAREPKGPWKNIHLSIKTYSGPGAFKLKHFKTGECFVGSTKNLYEALTNLRQRLAKGIYGNEKLTTAYQAEPEFELTVELTHDKGTNINEQLDVADIAIDRWQKEFGEKCTVVLRGRTRGVLGRRTATGDGESKSTRAFAKLSYDGQMNQLRTKAVDGAAIPARDFLHSAWFGAGV